MPLHPECAAIVAAAANAGGSPLDRDDPLAVRAAYAATTASYRHATGALAKIEDSAFAGPGGEVAVRIYRPHHLDSAAPSPALVFFHGGGWVLGDFDTHDHVCRHLAHGAGIILVAVDYRLAPEHKFPAALDDCVAATEWIAAHAVTLGIDATRLAVGGDSAGGNLATAIALRDRGGPGLRLQLLIYPAVDFTADNVSLQTNGEGYVLTRAALERFTDWYLPDRGSRADPRASPQLAQDHTRLPAAYIQTAEFDPLRDEGLVYAETLARAGTRVEHQTYPGMIHGFARMGGRVAMGLTALNDAAGVLRTALKPDLTR